MDDGTFILLWAIIGTIVEAIIGDRKGRAGAGAVLGLVLGPIGWLVVGLGPDYKATRDTKKCPFCAELVKVEARVCKHCGRDLLAGTNAPVQKTPVISQPLDQHPPSSRPKDIPTWVIIVGGALLIGLIYAAYLISQGQTESKPNPTVSGQPSPTPMLSTSAESATPEIRKAKPVLSSSPLAGQKASDTAKPDMLPLSRIIGQPESAVNKILGNPEKRHDGLEPPDFPGGTQVDYRDRPNCKALTTVFYRGKLMFIQFVFEPNPMSEEELFTALGLPKASFAVIKILPGEYGATQYRGTIDKHLIEIAAWRPYRPLHGEDGPLGFCGLVTIELVTPQSSKTELPRSPSSAASPALRGDLGITSKDIQKVLESEPFGVVFETSTTVNGEPRLWGKTKDGLAIVELIGPPTGLTKVDCLVGQPSDSPRAAIQNAGILLALLKKTLPAWNGSADWLNTALAASNRDGRETGDIETTFRRVHVRLHCSKELGMITLSISSPSATR